MFQDDLDLMGLRSDEVVYVGDSWDRGMVGAREAGIRGVWVCRFDDRERCKQVGGLAVDMISDLRELLGLLGLGHEK